MPIVYRIQCQSCGKGPGLSNFLAGWVTTDGGQGGTILPDGYLAVKLDNGEFKSLPHPVETSTLKGLGYSWNSAARQGRLHRIGFKICTKCGTFHEEQAHHNGMAGCLLGLASTPIALIALKFGLKTGWGTALFGACLLMFAIWGVVAFGSWWRWREPNSRLKLKSCCKCGATEFTTIQKSVGKTLICPQCGTAAMRCAIAGMS